jgi:hypothetical protein
MCGCNKRKSSFSAGQTAAPQQLGSRSMARKEAPAQAKLVTVTYNGPVGNHLVASPTRKRPTYGMHTNGDVFEVYAADQEAAPKMFVLAEELAEPVQEKNMQAPPVALKDAERVQKDGERVNDTEVAVVDGETEEKTGEKVAVKATTKAPAKQAESKESK